MPAFHREPTYGITFDYKAGDQVVFAYDVRLDPYTYIFAGQKAETVSANEDSSKVKVLFKNSGKIFDVDSRMIISQKAHSELIRQGLMTLASNNFRL